MLRKLFLCFALTAGISPVTIANDEIWVLIGASYFSQYEGMRPTGKVWLYRSRSSCEAGLMDVLSYSGDNTKRSLDPNTKKQVNVDSDDGYIATYVCVKKMIFN